VGWLDFLFPKYCVNCKKIGSYLCPNCFSYLSFDVNDICLVCKRQSFNGFTHPRCLSKYSIDGAFSALNYKGVAKKLVYKFKYKPHLTDLKTVLSDLFYEALIQKEGFNAILDYQPILVPIPLHQSKLKSRGYNQAEILAESLAQNLNLPSTLSSGQKGKTQNLLERTRDTRSQVGLKQEERQENMKNAFRISNNQFPISNNQFLLVDDVLTTGSTLLEAAKVLKKAGAKKVWGITLARD
jgi:competence protein ComFC